MSDEKRFIGTDELMNRTSLGRNRCLDLSKRIGATIHIPGIRRTLHDWRVFEEYFDSLKD